MDKKQQLLRKIEYHTQKIILLKAKLEALDKPIINNELTPKTRYVYALKCHDNHYYIGQTTNHSKRALQHLKGKGSWFTRKYPPIQTLEIITYHNITVPECMRYENELTEKYITQYGLDNVRGGDYIQKDAKHLRRRLAKF